MSEKKKTVSINQYATQNYLVRVEWYTEQETIQKFYEFSNKKKAEEFMKHLRLEFETPSIRLYREVLWEKP